MKKAGNSLIQEKAIGEFPIAFFKKRTFTNETLAKLAHFMLEYAGKARSHHQSFR
jgi:hypothetical protein